MTRLVKNSHAGSPASNCRRRWKNASTLGEKLMSMEATLMRPRRGKDCVKDCAAAEHDSESRVVLPPILV